MKKNTPNLKGLALVWVCSGQRTQDLPRKHTVVVPNILWTKDPLRSRLGVPNTDPHKAFGGLWKARIGFIGIFLLGQGYHDVYIRKGTTWMLNIPIPTIHKTLAINIKHFTFTDPWMDYFLIPRIHNYPTGNSKCHDIHWSFHAKNSFESHQTGSL